MDMMRRWTWVLGLSGLLAVFGAAVSWYVLGAADGPPIKLLLFGVFQILAYLTADRQQVGDKVRSRGFALSAGSVALQVVALLLAVSLFTVVYSRFDRTFDLTSDGVHTLSGHTVEVLAGLTEPVEIVAFFENGSAEGQTFRKLAQLYTVASPQVTLTWIDPLSNPVRAEMDEIVGSTVLVRQGDREQRLEIDFTEVNVTRRLVLVQSAEEHIVCWSVGHGEADPDGDTQPEGFGAGVIALEGMNYQVLNTAVGATGVPRECEVLLVVRPENDWLPWEREAFAAYIAEGGNAFVLMDPTTNTPNFNADLARFGLRVDDNVVFDADPNATFSNMQGTLALFGDRVLSHPITRGFGGLVVLPVARSVGYDVIDGILVKDLLRTTSQGWGETDLESPDVRPDPGQDLIGELPLAVVAEVVNPDVLSIVLPSDEPLEQGPPLEGDEPALDLEANPGRLVPVDFTPKAGGRIVLIGDADFAANQVLTVGNNRDFFLNVLAWLVGEEEQLGERPTIGDPLDLTGLQSDVICLVSVVFVPGMAILFALFAFLRRRRL